jgi:hypothetical protein
MKTVAPLLAVAILALPLKAQTVTAIRADSLRNEGWGSGKWSSTDPPAKPRGLRRASHCERAPCASEAIWSLLPRRVSGVGSDLGRDCFARPEGARSQ